MIEPIRVGIIEEAHAGNRCIAKMQADETCLSTFVFQFSFSSNLTLEI